ncbi:MAG: S8 family serine peptidase [Clostridia bacterium]|nr:S8 family serine peptidase [Clostridia bacterium]
MKKRVIPCFLAVVLTVVIVFSTLVMSISASILTLREAVVDVALIELLENAKEYELIPVEIWTHKIDFDKVEEKVQEKIATQKITRFVSNGICENHQTLLAEVQECISLKRTLGSEMQTKATKVVYSLIELLLEEKSNARDVFISKYAPVITMKLTAGEIVALSNLPQVEMIYYIPEVQAEDFSMDGASATGADVLRESLGLSGTGVKIGMIEKGVPDREQSYFDGADITYDPDISWEQNIRTHANNVASILVSQSSEYPGIVPDAELYCTIMGNRETYTWQRIEWLLDQGVQVINMSAGYVRPDSPYLAIDRLVDTIAIDYSVHFVAAAGGNYYEPLSVVAHPACAYNVIAVGAADETLTAPSHDSWYFDFATEANKPDILAPGALVETAATPTGCTGNSFAAPIVTGIIAQLIEYAPNVAYWQNGMKAILTAAINDDVLRYQTSSAMSDSAGAGLINAYAAYCTLRDGNYKVRSFPAMEEAGSTKSYSFTVASTEDPIRVSLAWLKHKEEEDEVIDPLADLTLMVYDPNGNLVANVTDPGGNLLITEFNPSVIGEYTIKVVLNTTAEKKCNFAVAWYFVQ